MKTKKTTVVLLVSILLFLACVIGFLIFPQEFIMNLSLTIMSIIPTVLSYLIFSKLNKNDNLSSAETPDYYEAIRKTLHTESQAQAADIMELMLANMKEIKDYYALSKAQAKNSFFLSVVMCISGFVLMAFSVVAPLLTETQNDYAFISAIGGVIIEVIAGTSLFVYRKSLAQLNHYYSELHENERFLSSVNLINKMSREKQDDMYEKVIQTQLEITGLYKVRTENKSKTN